MSEGTNPAGLGARQVIALITRREFLTRIRSKVFAISTILMVASVVALAVILHVAGGSTSSAKVGLTSQNASLAAPLSAVGKAVGQKVTTEVVPDMASGEQQLRNGSLSALLVGTPDAVTVVVKKDLKDTLRTTLTVLARQQALDAQVVKLGGDPAQVNAAVADTELDVRALTPGAAFQTQRIVLGVLAGVLIYLTLMIYGQGVAQGVVEEKTSRVVELLLTTLRPWQLMVGKVLGIGAVGVIQVSLVVSAGLATGLATGVLSLPSSVAVGAAIWALAWFLLGFAMYALMFAAAGALVSRQEDVGGVTSPLLMMIIVPYVIGVSVLPASPDNALAEKLSLVPLFSPMLMPMRIALGVAPAWQIAWAATSAVLLIVVLVGVTGRIYRNSVLRMGARVRLADAFRAA